MIEELEGEAHSYLRTQKRAMHGSRWLFLWPMTLSSQCGCQQGLSILQTLMYSPSRQKGVVWPPLAHLSSGWKRLLHCGREQAAVDQMVNQPFSGSTVPLAGCCVLNVKWCSQVSLLTYLVLRWGRDRERKRTTADCSLLRIDLQVSWSRPTSSPPCVSSQSMPCD